MSNEEKNNRPGDVVLIHIEDNPAGFARIEEVRGHARPGWFECDLLFLSQPLAAVTWILEREQTDGTPFTMGGRPVRIERLPTLGEVHSQVRAGGGTGEDDRGAAGEAPEAQTKGAAGSGAEDPDKPVPGQKVVPLRRPRT